MKVLNNTSNFQTIQVIPRTYPTSLTLSLRDDQTNDVVTYALEGVQFSNADVLWNLANWDWDENIAGFYVENDYLTIENVYSLINYHFYDLTITDQNGDVIYKDRIFCTDQPIVDFSVNDGEYVTENSYDNDYIII